MKLFYPDYLKNSTEEIYKSLSKSDKKIFDNYLDLCLTTCSEVRAKKIKMILMQFRDIIEKPFDQLTKDDIIKFLKIVNQSNRALWTKNDIKKIVKRFIKRQYRNLDLIDGDDTREAFRGVSKKIAFNHEKINSSTLITPEELEKILRATDSIKQKALFSLLYESGLRPQELRFLKWKDLIFEDSLNILSINVFSQKTRTPREVYVRDSIDLIKRWRKEFQFPNRTNQDFVFPSQFHRDKPLSNGTIGNLLRSLCKKANIRHLFPYLFRHTRATELHKKLPNKISAKLCGHSIETSEIYSHLSNEDVKTSILKEIYPTEITEESKNKYEEEIKKLKDSDRKTGIKLMKLFEIILQDKETCKRLKGQLSHLEELFKD